MSNAERLSARRWAIGIVAFLAVLVGGGLYAPSEASAQATKNPPPVTQPIDDKTLTKANGWDCKETSSGTQCVNTTTDPKNKYYKATAECSVSVIGEGAVNYICQAKLNNGSTVSSTQLVGTPGAPIQTNTETNAKGEVTASDNTTSPSSAVSAENGGDGCSLWRLSTWMTCLARGIAGVILDICTFFLGLAGALLNWVILRAVFQFSLLIGNSPGLLTAWGILRDIGNMLLLFGFLFIGLATILDLHTYTAKKTLPKLIIFAILMNFSLFAAEGIIDVSNGLTSVIYTQTNGATCQSTDVNGGLKGGTTGSNATNAVGIKTDANTAGKGFDDCAKNYGLASALMNSLGINSIFGIDNPTSVPATALIGMAVLCLIAAGVFLAAAIMLAIRAVVLTFLMVFAPLGFAGMAIPPLQNMAMQWWHRLINQAFFAPVFFLMIFVSISITNGLAGMSTRASLAQALSEGNSGAMGVIMIFVLIIGFMLASLIVAKKMGAAGASFATNFGMKVAFGLPARTANFAVGGGARLLSAGSRRLEVKDPQSWKGKAWNSVNGTLRRRGLQRLEESNLDLRRLPGVGLALSAAGATAAAKADEHASFKDMRHQWQERGARGRELDKQDKLEMQKLRLKQEANDPNGLSPESQQFLASLSAETIAADHDLQHALEGLASKLSADQFDGLMKSDKLKQNVKDQLSENRFKDVKKAMANGFQDKDKIRNLSNKDLELLAKYDAKSFQDLVQMEDNDGNSMMSTDQTDHLGKASALTQTQRDDVKKNTKLGRIEANITSTDAVLKAKATRYANSLGEKEKAKLSGNALKQAGVLAALTPADLRELMKSNKLDRNDRRRIGQAIRASNHPNRTVIQSWFASNQDADQYWR